MSKVKSFELEAVLAFDKVAATRPAEESALGKVREKFNMKRHAIIEALTPEAERVYDKLEE